MGLIRAGIDSVGGALADQWKEVIESGPMSDQTVFTVGQLMERGRGSNTKGTPGIITDGSVVHIGENQFMMLADGGKIVDYSAEAGYFIVDNDKAPSMFNGDFKEALKESFSRFQYGGMPPQKMEVYYVNTQEIKGIKFGTRNAINYFDDFYNAELFLRAHGTYSIRIVDPIKFYKEAVPKGATHLDIADINEQYMSEFLEALQVAINKMSIDGIRISHVVSQSTELSKYMRDILDEEWEEMRGIEVQSVGMASISYDEESQELINMRNRGAMLGDARVREGYVQGSIARGVEKAGENPAGSGAFVGVGMGMGAGGAAMDSFSRANVEQMKMDEEKHKAESQAGTEQGQASRDLWTCPECGTENTGNFCTNCGTKKPEKGNFCPNCGHENPAGAKFCTNCGNKLD